MSGRAVEGIPDVEYHAMPGLSATSMKWLLRSPRYYRWQMDHPRISREFDLGSAIHCLILGTGPSVAVLDFDSRRTNAYKAAVDEARAAGQTPVLKADYDAALAAADAVMTHPKARVLLELDGPSEVSLFADDPDTGVPLRGRLDRIGHLGDERLVNIDIKSTADARRHKVMRSIEDFGYEVQSEVYRHLLRQVYPDAQIEPTVLVFVEKDEPHEVRVVSLAHPDWIDGGVHKMRAAIDIYQRCVERNQWPGDDDEPGEPEAIEPRPYYLLDALDEDDDVELTL